MADFRNFTDTLREFGIYDIVLPFILVYAIVYAVLEHSKFFSNVNDDSKKTINVIISLCFGLFAIFSIQVVENIQYIILNSVFLIVVFMIILILLALIFGEEYLKIFKNENDKYHKWFIYSILGIILITILITIYHLFGLEDTFIGGLTNNDYDFTTLIVIIIVGVIIYFVTKEEDKSYVENHKDDKN